MKSFSTFNSQLSIENRNESYFSIAEKLPQKRKTIFICIRKSEPCTALEISQNYNIPINEVVGRISELKNAFLIYECGSKFNLHTGKKNTLYSPVKNLDQQIDLINQRFVELRSQKEQFERDFHLGISTLTRDLILKEIRQNPDLYKLFTNTFEATFGYKPTCSCSFFNDLQKLRNHLKNQQK